jgi:hypothetical protein
MSRRMPGRGAVSRQLLWLIQPERIVGASKVRIGNPDGDGGYVMVDAFDGIAGALSVGIGADVSWDLEIANRGIEVFQYDHTVSGPPVSHRLFHFLPVGLGEAGAPDGSFIGLDRMVAAIPGDGDVIAKIDAEGAEWPALSSASRQTMSRLAQMVIELHAPMPGDATTGIRNLAILERVARTHAVVHVHANNYGGIGDVDGIRVPDVMELTYLRRTGLRFEPCIEEFPTTLDRPNDPERADISMSEILSLAKSWRAARRAMA